MRQSVDWTAFTRPKWAALAILAWLLLALVPTSVVLFAIGAWFWFPVGCFAFCGAHVIITAWDRGWRP